MIWNNNPILQSPDFLSLRLTFSGGGGSYHLRGFDIRGHFKIVLSFFIEEVLKIEI